MKLDLIINRKIMSDIFKSNNKIYLVIGLGISGYWAAKFLNSIGKRVIILEKNSNPKLIIHKEHLERSGIEVFPMISFWDIKIVMKFFM